MVDRLILMSITLVADEIKVQPTSPELQSTLVRLYLDWSKDEPHKLDEAYNYVADVEARRPFTHSLTWYQTLIQVAEVCTLQLMAGDFVICLKYYFLIS